VSVTDDAVTTAASVSDFVNAYNDVIKYISENDAVTRDDSKDTNIFGPLASTSLDENLVSALRSAFSSSSISGGAVNTLSELGITTQRDGTLAFDSSKFKDALADDPESVRSITRNLGEGLASVNGIIAQFTRFGGLFGTAHRANDSEIELYNKQISEVEKSLSQQETALQARYARLESVIGKLNSQQTALAGLRAG
jgi:flagellar hook-associated protein 2